jgi:hypothetical protein
MESPQALEVKSVTYEALSPLDQTKNSIPASIDTLDFQYDLNRIFDKNI